MGVDDEVNRCVSLYQAVEQYQQMAGETNRRLLHAVAKLTPEQFLAFVERTVGPEPTDAAATLPVDRAVPHRDGLSRRDIWEGEKQ